jgi:tight adherence protein C
VDAILRPEALLTPPGGLDTQVILVALVFGAALLIVLGFHGLLGGGRDPIRERLAAGTGGPGGAAPPAPAAPLRIDAQERLKGLDRYVAPKDPARRSAMRLRMQRAGYRGDSAIRVYYSARAVLGLGLAASVSLGLPLLTDRSTPLVLFGASMAACAAGFLLPTFWLASRIGRRRDAIRDSFPDALDMLLVCVEAGQGLDQALARVAAEIEAAHRVLAEEFATVCTELRAGKERREVLRDLARRTELYDLGAFVTVLVQADQYGTSVADALRVYAAEMRHKRMMRAEEQANKLPVKLALGTMAFTLPPVLLVLGGPSAIMIFRTLTGMAR